MKELVVAERISTTDARKSGADLKPPNQKIDCPIGVISNERRKFGDKQVCLEMFF